MVVKALVSQLFQLSAFRSIPYTLLVCIAGRSVSFEDLNRNAFQGVSGMEAFDIDIVVA